MYNLNLMKAGYPYMTYGKRLKIEFIYLAVILLIISIVIPYIFPIWFGVIAYKYLSKIVLYWWGETKMKDHKEFAKSATAELKQVDKQYKEAGKQRVQVEQDKIKQLEPKQYSMMRKKTELEIQGITIPTEIEMGSDEELEFVEKEFEKIQHNVKRNINIPQPRKFGKVAMIRAELEKGETDLEKIAGITGAAIATIKYEYYAHKKKKSAF